MTRRLLALDALRGAALFGILLVNAQAWIVGLEPFASLLLRAATPLDHLAWLTVNLLVTAKVYPLFGFLFGYGLAQQARSLRTAGATPLPVLQRRLVVLLGLGVLHGLLLFFGDILTTWAVAGLLALTVLGQHRRILLRALRTWLGLAAVSITMAGLLAWNAPPPAWPADYAFLRRAGDFFSVQVLQLPLFLPQAMVYLLLGMLAEQIGLFRHPGLHARLWARLRNVGLYIGLPLSLVFTLLKWWPVAGTPPGQWIEVVSTVLNHLCVLLSPLYLALFVRWARHARPGTLSRALLHRLAAAGRLSLTLYLTQSLAMLVLLQGLNWTAHLNAAGIVLFACGVFGAQLLFAAWWGQRFGSGPFERLWRRAAGALPGLSGAGQS